MHIPENYLSPSTCAVMAAAVVPVWVHAVHKIRKEMPQEKMPMLGIGAAFSFLAMMFNVPLPGGTTGHAVGGTLIALLFGPDAACIGVSVALLIQALIFGDGGVLSFGANCFNMAFVLPYAGYGVYRLTVKLCGVKKEPKPAAHYIGAAVGSYVGINLAALCAAIEFGIQPILFRDGLGNALYCPYGLSVSVPAMMISHLTVAGLVEAVFTVAVYAFVRKTSPSLSYPYRLTGEENKAKKMNSPLFALAALLIAATPLGLIAAGTAFGEWGAEEIAETAFGGKALGYTPSGIANGFSLSALMPDYGTEGANTVITYILSALLGVSLLIIFFKLISLPMKKGMKNSNAARMDK